MSTPLTAGSVRPPAMRSVTTPSARRSDLLVSLSRLVDVGVLRVALRPILLHLHPAITRALPQPVLWLAWDYRIVIAIIGLFCLLFLFIVLSLTRLLMKSPLPNKVYAKNKCREGDRNNPKYPKMRTDAYSVFSLPIKHAHAANRSNSGRGKKCHGDNADGLVGLGIFKLAGQSKVLVLDTPLIELPVIAIHQRIDLRALSALSRGTETVANVRILEHPWFGLGSMYRCEGCSVSCWQCW